MPFNMGQAVGYLMLDTSGFTSGFKTAQGSLNQFMNQSNDAETRMKGLGTAATAAGATMTKGLTVPLVGIGAAAVKVTADFDSQMSKVAAISGATGEEFDALRDKAREMGAETQFSATEAGQAFEYMAMAGWKTEDMLNGIEGIMNLAAAAGEDLGTTSDIVTDALTAFNMTAEESAHFADILAAASSNSNTNVAMMGETFKYVAPLCGAMGYSAEDAAVAIGLMANAGIKSSQAGTSLRGVLSRMAKPTDEVAMAMETLGISLDDGQGHMYSLMEIMDQLRDGFSNDLLMPMDEFMAEMAELDAQFEAGEITEEAYADMQDVLMKRAYGAEGALKAQYAAMLGGRNAMSGLLAIVNASDEDYQKLIKSVEQCSEVFVKTADGSIMLMSEALEQGLEIVEEYNGESERMAATMRDNLSGQLTILKSQLQELAISIGDLLMPYLRRFVDWLQKVVDKLNNMDDETKERIVRIAAIVAAIGPVLLILGKLFTVIGTIISVLKVLKTVFMAVNAVMLANPIVLVIAAIAALIAAFIYLWNNCEGFREFWINLWETIKTAVSTAVEWIKEKFDQAKEWFSNFGENMKQLWEDVKTVVGDAILAVIESIVKFAVDLYEKGKEAFENFKRAIKEKWEEIKTWFREALKNFIETIKNRYESMKSAGRNFLSAFWNGLKEKWNSIRSWVQEKVNWLRDKWNSAKNWMSNLVSGSYATGTDYIMSDRVVQVHEGEAILSKQENKERMKGVNGLAGGTVPIVLNITEKIDGMTLAKNQYRYNLVLDKNHGVSLINA